MPVLYKKRNRISVGGDADSKLATGPRSGEIMVNLSSLGFKSLQNSDYYEQSDLHELFVNVTGDNRPHAQVDIMGIKVIGLLDCGAHQTVIGAGAEQLVRTLQLKTHPCNVVLKTANGAKIPVRGYINLPITFNDRTKIISTLVAPSLTQQLYLGHNFWEAFGIKPAIPTECDISTLPQEDFSLTESQRKELEEVKSLFKVANSEYLDSTNLVKHRIELKEEFKNRSPIRINPYPFSPTVQKKMNEALEKMLRQGVIEKGKSDWCLPTVPVIKPTGEVRLCLDARRLNERTQRDAYPLPHQDRILGRLGPCKYLSTIDLSQAFLQIPLHEDSKKYTAFSVLGKGLFQFTRLPFGLVNSPATLAKLMDEVLGYGELEPGVFIYLDDIVIVSESFESHLESLREVSRRLVRANLSINIEKSKFCLSELPYLGYILSREGLRPNAERVEAIINYERPQSVRALRRFLGMANYYRRFLHNFSSITAPLTNLLKNKPKGVVWSTEAEQAFNQIKESLITAPILSNPNFDLPFCIQADASDQAIASILTQQFAEGEKVIAYFSQKLNPAQQRYKIAEKEGLAVMASIEKFRCYVEGSHFTVITDSSALTYIMQGKWKSSSRLSRWSIELQQYDFEIKHRRGKDNIIPDALSRAVEEMELGKSDNWYSNQFAKVSASPHDVDKFKIEGGKLFKFVPGKNDVLDFHFEWKLCVPNELRTKVLQQEHDNQLHIGFEKTLDRLKKTYFWPRMASDTKKYIQKCVICRESKPSNVSQHPEMGHLRLTTKPFQIIAIDYIQSLPRSKSGNTHLFVIIDLFSKLCLLVPVKKISAELTIRILENQWFRRYSVPEYIISDNATSFLAKDFKSFLEKYGVQHWTNSRYHSQANPAERLNRTINACIRTYVKTDQRLWDSRVAEIEHILNNTIHASTGYTPYKIIFGHEIVTRGEQHKIDCDTKIISNTERNEQKQIIDKKIHEIVRKNIQKNYNENKLRYDLRFPVKAPIYEIGQRVFKRNFHLSSAGDNYNAKLGSAYTPCIILSRRGTSSYELADEHGKNIGVFSAADLKPGLN